MTLPHRYAIIANPVSGAYTAKARQTMLQGAADILKATVFGLEIRSPDDLAECAREQARRSDVLVVAGGDGTMSLVINAVDLKSTTLAFLPMGTGNALTHALGYRGGPMSVAARIRDGVTYAYDLIDCDGRRKAFMTSLGLDGAVIRNYEAFRKRGYHGLNAHIRAILQACFGGYRPGRGEITVDGITQTVDRLMSYMVVKQPFFGMGLKVVPRARWNDGRLHSLVINSGLPAVAVGLATGFTIGNRIGTYRPGRKIGVVLDTPLTLQIDGDIGWTDRQFGFEILPGLLRLRH